MVLGDIRKKMDLLGRSGLAGFVACVLSPGGAAVAVFRLGVLARSQRPGVLSVPLKLVYWAGFYLVQACTGISVQAYTSIGKRFVVLNHGCVFVVAERIGDDFTVCQGVTVGNVRGSHRLPVIGSNVFLEPGAKVLGEVTVGDNVVVRANSLVLSDVPPGSIAVGNPARVMKRTPIEERLVPGVSP